VTTATGLPATLGRTQKIIMLHMNFRSRAAAHGDFPQNPTYYLKPPSTLVAGGTPVARPAGTRLLIAEGEIALIIGERVHRADPDRAWSAVSHVAAANDITVLDFLWADPSLTRAKGWDGFTPIGQLVDARSVDPRELEIRVTVNGVQRQHDHTRTLLFPFADLVSDLSHVMTLEPGDIVLTGTPAGASTVEPGDEVTVEITGLSSVTTPIVEAETGLPPLCPAPRVTPALRAHAQGVAAPRPATIDGQTWKELRRGPVTDLARRLRTAGVGHVELPLTLTTGGPVAGHALTVRLVPRRACDEPADDHGMRPVSAAGADEIVVVAANGAEDAACLPEALLGELHRAEALVTDGTIPDLDDFPLPTTARSRAMAPWSDRHRCAGVNVPIVIGGMLVEPGDVVVVDTAACLLVPAAHQSRLTDALACGRP
jgi:5-oxopent-3-ene-1,2,5-tricarboxylate decarboxylase / 2-hydroxyhepta-2,4-diene-1,7-dioate isomerase